jgi:hypothetical protein
MQILHPMALSEETDAFSFAPEVECSLATTGKGAEASLGSSSDQELPDVVIGAESP